jgi:hypothetical protein
MRWTDTAFLTEGIHVSFDHERTELQRAMALAVDGATL